MNNLKYIIILAFLYNANIKAQPPVDFALESADSMLNAYRTNQLSSYLELTYPGVVKYYGGTKNFKEFITRSKDIESQDAGTDKLHVLQIVNDAKEWQCVIQRTHQTVIDNKKAAIISYMIGQSVDDGVNWKFVDVALNSVANLNYIMPDMFTTLTIPMREVVYQKSIAAH